MGNIILKRESIKEKLVYLIVLLYPFIEVTYLFVSKTQGYVTFKVLYFLIWLFCILISKKNILFVKAKTLFAFVFSIGFMLFQVEVNHESVSSDTLSFVFFVFCVIYASDKEFMMNFRKTVEKYEKIWWCFALYYLGVILLSFFVGDGIASSWNIVSIKGPYALNHDFAYTLCVLYCLYSFLYKANGEKKNLVLSFVFAILIVMTGVRSATLAMLILLIYDYKGLNTKKKIMILSFGIVVLLILAASTDILVNNPFVQKQKSASATNDVTNGRANLWVEDIDYYLNETAVYEKLMGIGVAGIRNVNYQAFQTAIQAHNDLLNVLIGYGIFGLVYVIYLLKRFMKNTSLYLLIFILLLALTNGFIMYSIVFSIPMLRLFFENDKKIDT